MRSFIVTLILLLTIPVYSQDVSYSPSPFASASGWTFGGPIIVLNGDGLDSAPLGDELVANGSFVTNLTGWSAGAGWAWAAGDKAQHTAGNIATLAQNITDVVNGDYYQISTTISGRTAGSIAVSLGSVSLTAQSTNATVIAVLIAGASGTLTLAITPTTDFDGAVTDISVKVILGTTTAVLIAGDSTDTEFASLRGSSSAFNLLLGYQSGWRLTTGTYNVGYGYQTFNRMTTGNYNVAFGAKSCERNLNGIYNTCLGHSSMANATSNNNTAVGAFTLNNATGNNNTAVGYSALGTSTGSSNVAIGHNALLSATSGSSNTAIGTSALFAHLTGTSNTVLGLSAGYVSGSTPSATNASTSCARCTFIGSQSGLGSSTQRTNATAIGAESYVDSDNTVSIGDENVTNVKIGSASQASADLKLITFTATLFAALGTPSNGTIAYCSDCTIASPCADSGTGALAKRLNGAWVCN